MHRRNSTLATLARRANIDLDEATGAQLARVYKDVISELASVLTGSTIKFQTETIDIVIDDIAIMLNRFDDLPQGSFASLDAVNEKLRRAKIKLSAAYNLAEKNRKGESYFRLLDEASLLLREARQYF